MGQNGIKISVNEITKMQEDLMDYENQLVSTLDSIKDLMIELETYYNTPTGKILRQIIIDFLINKKEYISRDYHDVVEKLKPVTSIYEDTIDTLSKMVNS